MTSSSSISGVRRRSCGEHRALGEQQRQQRQALLALRAVDAQLAPVARDRELVAVWPVAGEAALEIAGQALAQLGHVLLARRAARERGRYSSATSPLQPELRGARGERLGEQRDRGGAVGAQLERAGGQLAVPRRRASRPTRGPSGCARAARCAGRARASTACAYPRAAARSRRRTWSRWARRTRGRALDELEPVGQEDAHERAASRRRAAARRARRRRSCA